MQREKIFLDQLIESLKLVAADAETQIGLLPEWVHIPDEIALTFGESYILFDQVIDAGLVDEKQAELIHHLDRKFEEMSGPVHHEFWTLDAMRTHPKWEEFRELAAAALQKLGQELTTPNLGWITYVGGEKPSNYQ